MIFKYKFEPELSDVNTDKRVKNKSLLRFFENIAAKHSDSIHNGLNDIIDIGFSWVLLEWQLHVTDRPKYGDVLEVHTWVRNSTKLYSYRDFEVYANGVKKAEGSSKWLLVDIATLRPKKITDDLVKDYGPEPDKNVFGLAEFEKMKELPEYDTETDYIIRKSDIDINGHVHNLVYADMAYEVLDAAEFDSLKISYKKEIKYGDAVKICKRSEGGRTFVKISGADGAVHALAELAQPC